MFPVTCVLHIRSTSSSPAGSDKTQKSASACDAGLRGLGSESRSASAGLCNYLLGGQVCFELSHMLKQTLGMQSGARLMGSCLTGVIQSKCPPLGRA